MSGKLAVNNRLKIAFLRIAEPSRLMWDMLNWLVSWVRSYVMVRKSPFCIVKLASGLLILYTLGESVAAMSPSPIVARLTSETGEAILNKFRVNLLPLVPIGIPPMSHVNIFPLQVTGCSIRDVVTEEPKPINRLSSCVTLRRPEMISTRIEKYDQYYLH